MAASDSALLRCSAASNRVIILSMSEEALTIDRFLDPVAECLTPEVARRIANLHTDEQTRAVLEELRVKANLGTLSDAERVEYEELIDGLDIFSLLKAKARAVLAKSAS